MKRIARWLSSPLRRYVSERVSVVTDEIKRASDREREGAAMDHQGVLVAIDRLQETMGFLGLQLSIIREELDAMRGDPAPPDANDGSADTTR